MGGAKGVRLNRARHAATGTAASLAVIIALTSAAAPADRSPDPAAPPASPTPEAPPPQPPPQLTQADVDRAVARLDSTVETMRKRTGVPGVAVGVVYKDRVIHLKGFGERKVGEPEAVGPDTVFQLASLSKPIASTVIAGAVGDKTVDWNTTVAEHLPGFALKDPWVTRHATITDLLSHRSGLPDHAGDLLEDLGYDQNYVLSHLRYEPLAPFRASYAYTNFGFTAAAEAVARAKGVSWEKLSEDILYEPAGMEATSSAFADYEKAANKAVTHVRTADGSWQAKYVRDADAQAPAGGASSTARDMMRWLRLQLADGKLDGRQLVDAQSLEHTHLPEIPSQPPRAPAGRTGFYGIGWNVGYDDQGRLRLSHSGAFELGANTNVTMLPGERLGIVVLTNGQPVGLADAVALDFFDTAQYGRPTIDWLSFFSGLYEQMDEQDGSRTNYARPPANARPARDDRAYTGTYDSPYYGKAVVTEDGGGLVLELGPAPQKFRLTHYSGDTFSFRTKGENAVGLTGVTFSPHEGTSRSFRVEYLDENGLGTFTRR
ncbi:serine hydrolase [Streptomyces sp. NPDC059169]|uniref:serine hydrolase n=1 Tax=unclassified Streptomyces TaxID=2593676 RepID=UPI0036C20A5C